MEHSWHLYDLALEVTERHFHCFTCTYGAQESNLGCLYSKRGGSRSREGLGKEVNYGWTLGGSLKSALSCWGLRNLGAVSTESNSPKLNRMANEDYIDFLLRSINKINWPEELSTDQGEPNINIYSGQREENIYIRQMEMPIKCPVGCQVRSVFKD